MTVSKECISIFKKSIEDYHILDSVDQEFKNPFFKNEVFKKNIYKKSWIDTVQWHLEDIIRKPSIDPNKALKIKRRIDISNQNRTDMVEVIDDYFFSKFSHVKVIDGFNINTETPAWAIDRLSILELKIFHMDIEANRPTADQKHRLSCFNKLELLKLQRKNLSKAIDQLIENISQGKIKALTYKQMKMYNDDKLNPELYKD